MFLLLKFFCLLHLIVLFAISLFLSGALALGAGFCRGLTLLGGVVGGCMYLAILRALLLDEFAAGSPRGGCLASLFVVLCHFGLGGLNG